MDISRVKHPWWFSLIFLGIPILFVLMLEHQTNAPRAAMREQVRIYGMFYGVDKISIELYGEGVIFES